MFPRRLLIKDLSFRSYTANTFSACLAHARHMLSLNYSHQCLPWKRLFPGTAMLFLAASSVGYARLLYNIIGFLQIQLIFMPGVQNSVDRQTVIKAVFAPDSQRPFWCLLWNSWVAAGCENLCIASWCKFLRPPLAGLLLSILSRFDFPTLVFCFWSGSCSVQYSTYSRSWSAQVVCFKLIWGWNICYIWVYISRQKLHLQLAVLVETHSTLVPFAYLNADLEIVDSITAILNSCLDQVKDRTVLID